MPNNHEFAATPYSLVAKMKKSVRPANPEPLKPGQLPESHGESVSPDFLLHHTNRFDKNVYTPEQSGVFKPEPVKTA